LTRATSIVFHSNRQPATIGVMALIAFLMDIEEGHLFPSFELSAALRSRGHRVVYLGVYDNRDFVERQGFEFYPLFGEAYPQGYRETYGAAKSRDADSSVRSKPHLEGILGGAFDGLLRGLRPDLFVVSLFLSLEALLLYYALGIQPVIFTPFLREAASTVAMHCLNSLINLNGDEVLKIVEFLRGLGIPVTSMEAMVRPLNGFCELIACPEELEIEQVPRRDNVHYLGPSVRKAEGLSQRWHPPVPGDGRRIIYASLGSQSAAYGVIGRSLLAKVVSVMERPAMREMHLLLAGGAGGRQPEQMDAPGNVTFLEWAPQTEILRIASLAIIHGGLGTIKECIHAGVPMVVVPFKYDQPLNARRVAYHNLGITLAADGITEEGLLAGMVHALNDEHIRAGIDSMRQVFRRRDELSIGPDVIEKCLRGKGR